MGLFDFFKKKPVESLWAQEPKDENHIEFVLRKATTEPAYRPELYKLLMSENLVIITRGNTGEGKETLKEGTTVDIVTLPSGEIPVFTSQARIFDNQIVNEEVSIMELRGEDLFRLAVGAAFKLNPYSDYRKDLLAHEVESMLDGTVLESGKRQLIAEEDTPVQIGQPKNYPTEIINSLNTLFEGLPQVKKAYMGWIYNPADQNDPHFIFALDVDGDEHEAFNAAGFTVQQHLKEGDVVDFMPIGDHSLSDYFTKQTQPFYTRN